MYIYICIHMCVYIYIYIYEKLATQNMRTRSSNKGMDAQNKYAEQDLSLSLYI